VLRVEEIAFEKYRVIKLLGEGGMGTVYLAENVNVGNKWAIKEIKSKGQLTLLVEPDILKRLKHPHLPRIVDVIRTDTGLYIVEDYFEGRNLKELLANEKSFSEQRVVKWARQLAEILVYLHNLNPPIIYRDLKPANIIIDESDDLKLIDFGIASVVVDSEKGPIAYSKGYASPEQYLGRFDPRTDIYGFGATFYHVLSGNKYDINRPVRLRELNKGFSEGIDFILDKCLQKDPEHRYQSAAELYTDLKNIHKLSRAYKVGVWKRRAIVALIILGLGAGLFSINLGVEQKEITNENLFSAKISEGVDLCAKGKYNEAEQAFYEALKYKDDIKVYHNITKLYLQRNQPQEAINFLVEKMQKGIIQADAESLYLLGSAYFSLQDYGRAVSYFQKAVEADSSPGGRVYEDAMRDLAVSYGRMGDYAEAERTVQTLLATINSSSPTSHYVMGELNLAKGNYNEALSHFNAAQRDDPKNIRYRLSIARLYGVLSSEAGTTQAKIDNLQQAIRVVEEAQGIDPLNVQAMSDHGKYCFDLGQLYQATNNGSASRSLYQKALLSFNKLRDIDNNANTVLNIAIINDKLNNREAADRAFREALSLDEGDSHINFVYGMFKLKHKDYTGAYEYLQRVVGLNKNPEEVSVAKARIQELRQKGWIQ